MAIALSIILRLQFSTFGNSKLVTQLSSSPLFSLLFITALSNSDLNFIFNKGHTNNGHIFPVAQCESTFLLFILQWHIKLHGIGKNQHDFVKSKSCQTNFFSFLFFHQLQTLADGIAMITSTKYHLCLLTGTYIMCF